MNAITLAGLKEAIVGLRPVMILIRGVPGTGKSTLASKLGVPYLETDQYFTAVDGTYTFDHTRIKDAHEWCKKSSRFRLECGQTAVISNTFVRSWELKPYVEMAEEHGYDVVIVRMTKEYGTIHAVPEHALVRMRSTFSSVKDELSYAD